MMLGVSVVIWFSVLNTVTAGDTNATPAGYGFKQMLASQQEVTKQLQQGIERIITSIKQSAVQFSLAVGTSGSSVELLAIKNKLVDLEANQKATKTQLEETLKSTQVRLKKLESNRKSGSTFIRWGRKTCDNASHLVYSGVAGGSWYSAPGAAANPLCLTMAPQFDGTPLPRYYAQLFGAEYENLPNHHDHDVPCSVCHVPQSITIMIPATRACPKGWTTQYKGHLAAGYPKHAAANQYVCLDKDPENASNRPKNQNGKLFYYTSTVCGRLPCPPYVNHKVVLCVVCSK